MKPFHPFKVHGYLFPLLLFFQPLVYAAHYQLESDMSETLVTQTHLLDRYEGCFCYDETMNFLSLSPGLSIDFENGVTGVFRGDAIWEHFFKGDETRGYFVNGDEDDDSEFELALSEAYLDVKLDAVALQLGFQPVQFGNGFIFADNVPGAVVAFEKQNFSLELTGIQIFDASPMVGLAAGYKMGLFERIDVFAIWFDDQDDVFKETAAGILSDPNTLIGPILTDALTRSKGNVSWFGVSGSKFIGNVYFNFTGAYEYGHGVVYHNSGKTDLDFSAFFFDVSLESNVTNRFSAGAFCFLASGDRQPFRDGMSFFFSPFAYNPRASLFFDANFLDRDDENTFVIGGTTLFGVISPGIKLSFELKEDFYIESKAVTFFAQDPPSHFGSWYGWEIDLGLEYAYNNKYLLFAEAARFEQGDVLKDYFGLSDQSKPALRFLVGGQYNFNFH